MFINIFSILQIRDSTGARIVFPSEKDEDKETIIIIGRKEQIEKAKLELEKTIKEIDNLTEAEMTVNPVHHKHFVSRRGEVIQQITNECGGTVTISFPRPNCESDKVGCHNWAGGWGGSREKYSMEFLS